MGSGEGGKRANKYLVTEWSVHAPCFLFLSADDDTPTGRMNAPRASPPQTPTLPGMCDSADEASDVDDDSVSVRCAESTQEVTSQCTHPLPPPLAWESSPALDGRWALLDSPRSFTDAEPVTTHDLRKILSSSNSGGDRRTVKHLTITVDTREEQYIDDIGVMVPSLEQLHLLNSSLASMRDLGTSLTALRVLRAPRCGLRELDGLSALPQLEEIYLSFNCIWELSAAAFHENLEIVDLEGNDIGETLQVSMLATCPKLYCLSLEGNPLSSRCDSVLEYRRVVCANVPQLQLLDDQPIRAGDRQPCERPDTARELWARASEEPVLPTSAALLTAEESCLALAVEDDLLARLKSNFPTGRKYSGTANSENLSPTPQCSVLTHGTGMPLTGNVTRGLRLRQRSDGSSSEAMAALLVQSAEDAIGERPTSSASGDGPASPSRPPSSEMESKHRTIPSLESAEVGAATRLTDEEIINLLRQRPKDVKELRTRANFQRFFFGMERETLKRLLHEAFAHMSPEASSAKVEKRLQLFVAEEAMCPTPP